MITMSLTISLSFYIAKIQFFCLSPTLLYNISLSSNNF